MGIKSRDICSPEMAGNRAPIIWVDLEMTGLDTEKHRIIEMAVIVTDYNLNIIAKGPEIVIHQAEAVLNDMSEWCVNQFAYTGLSDQVKESKVSTEECEQQMLDFVRKHTTAKQAV